MNIPIAFKEIPSRDAPTAHECCRRELEEIARGWDRLGPGAWFASACGTRVPFGPEPPAGARAVWGHRGGMRISPRSYRGDGVLDALVFKGPKADSFTLLPKIYRGAHIPQDHIREFRVKRSLTIEADRPLPIQADGEVLGQTPPTFEVIPQAIRMKL